MARKITPKSGLGFLIALLTSFIILGSSASHSVFADQLASELPKLFDELAEADDSKEAYDLEQAIWAHWLTGPDEASDTLMLQIRRSIEQGKLQVGLVLCNQLVDAYPDYSEGWNKRATIYYMMDRLDDSVADIQTTLELEPKHFGALSGLGLILMRTGDAEGALAAFEAVLSINPLSELASANAVLARGKLGTDI